MHMEYLHHRLSVFSQMAERERGFVIKILFDGKGCTHSMGCSFYLSRT